MDIPLTPILGRALAAYLNQTLTPEVAAKLASEVLVQCYPGRVVTSGIAPRTVGSYTLQCQALCDVLEEMKVLHAEHWQETEGYRHKLAMKADYPRMLDVETQGRFVLVTARHSSGQLVGNFAMYLSRSAHTQTLIATEDTVFVTKAHRRGRLGVELIRYAERVAAYLGAAEMNVSVKLVNGTGPMIERMGYTAYGKQYCKILKEPANVLI